MAALTHAIRIFQSGGLSPDEFFAQIDRALATDQGDPAKLLEILSEENTKVPLPPDVYAEVHRRIEHRTEAQGSRGEDTGLPTQAANGTGTMPAAEGVIPPGAEPERMKGVGDTLNGRFVLEECLGFGGMGTVYKALDLRKLEASDRNPYIAIKLLNVQFRGHPKSLIALQREAKKAQKLAHPNIVTVYDFDRDNSMVYLTMEYLSGKPLNRLLRAPDFRGMSHADAMPIIKGMGEALSYAHQRGFVHCDFKPANVFLTDTGEVKVIDFGIARVFQRPEEDVEATVFDPGSLGGLTPAYASPEMLEHREPDPRDDVYALGCITYELLTGRHPFNRVAASQARASGMVPERPKDLGNRQWRALRAALSFERESRTPSVARFLQDLSGSSPRAGGSLALVGSSLASALLVAAGLVWYWQSTTEEREAAPQPAPAPPAETARVAPPAPPLSLDAVTPVLARVPCSALAASVRNDTVQVRGFLPERYGAARLRETLGAIPGVRSVSAEVQEVAEDKCSVLEPFAPYWVRNRQSAAAASLQTKGRVTELKEGDSLIVDVRTPAYESYVNLDYYVLDGTVVHLVPSPRLKENRAPPNYAATIGSLGNWAISKPFGTELIVLVATPAPLFDGLRPEHESKAEYLRAVEKRLEQLAAKHGPERIAVDFVQITTSAR